MLRQPPVVHQLLDDGMLIYHCVDGWAGRINHHGQPQRFVHPALPVVHRLLRQADAQIAAVAFKDADVSAHHVVQHFVAAPQPCGVAGGGVVLPVDPVGDQHGRCHERLQQAAVGVFLGVIVVQKAASLQCSTLRPVPGRDDEGCVAGQTPFRACLGAIVGAPAQLLQQIVVRCPWGDVQVRCSFSADLVTGMV